MTDPTDVLVDDVILKITDNLSLDDINALCRTNQRYNDLICNKQGFWRARYIRDFNYNPDNVIDWKKEYKNRIVGVGGILAIHPRRMGTYIRAVDNNILVKKIKWSYRLYDRDYMRGKFLRKCLVVLDSKNSLYLQSLTTGEKYLHLMDNVKDFAINWIREYATIFVIDNDGNFYRFAAEYRMDNGIYLISDK